MYEFHTNKERYFEIQYKNAVDHVIPFINDGYDLSKPMSVLEIGCAEAGVLKAFTELGHNCVGIELSESRTELARQFMKAEIEKGRLKLLAKNVYDIDVNRDLGQKFDLIILKDVIEHIHDQEKFMAELQRFLQPGGKVFFGFPPWQMPFGGHQQICRSKFLSKLPYYHLLPKVLYKGMLRLFGEKDKVIDDLLEIKATGISMERFERILKNESYQIIKRQQYLFNPIYEYKFNIKARKQWKLIGAIPYLRNCLTTCVYYLVE